MPKNTLLLPRISLHTPPQCISSYPPTSLQGAVPITLPQQQKFARQNRVKWSSNYARCQNRRAPRRQQHKKRVTVSSSVLETVVQCSLAYRGPRDLGDVSRTRWRSRVFIKFAKGPSLYTMCASSRGRVKRPGVLVTRSTCALPALVLCTAESDLVTRERALCLVRATPTRLSNPLVARPRWCMPRKLIYRFFENAPGRQKRGSEELPGGGARWKKVENWKVEKDCVT